MGKFRVRVKRSVKFMMKSRCLLELGFGLKPSELWLDYASVQLRVRG